VRRFELVLLCALVIGGIVWIIVDDSPVPPSADAQEPLAVECLKRAGLEADSEVGTGVARDVDSVLYVKDGDGARVAVVYLADLREDLDVLAERLRDDQKTYDDYEGETIEHRGTSVIRMRTGYPRAGAIRGCMDRAAKVEDA
jgi:hypothetical protein